MRSVLRELLQTGSGSVGTWITLTDPTAVEVAGVAGFDFVAIDLEHSTIGLETLVQHLRAAALRGLGTLVRLPSPEPKLLLRVLDAGAEGVVVPGVVDGAGARAALAACRYPPAGDRGMSSLSRAADFGAHGLTGLRALADASNAGVVAGLMIEDEAAVKAIENILASPGLDLVFIGPTDLSASLGVLGTAADPRVTGAIERVLGSCAVAGVPAGLPVGNSAYPLSAAQLRSRGVRLLTAMTDVALLAGAMRAAARDGRDG